MAKNLMGWLPKTAQWQKRYKGRLYKVSCNKLNAPATKAGSLQAANEWWQTKLAELVAETAPPPLPLAQRRWEQMAQWSEQNGKPQSTIDLMRASAADPEKARHDWEEAMTDGDRAVWMERLRQSGILYKSEGRRLPTTKTSLDKLVQAYIGIRKGEAEAGQLSLGRWDNCRRYLTHWQQWAGSIAISALNESHLQAYHSHLLGEIKAKRYSQETAKSNLTAIKGFYRWLWKTRVIAEGFRNLDDITIKVRATTPQTLSLDYIETLLSKSNDREKLYWLLMLNIGATQVDIAKLTNGEVDFDKGVITRKRSKTQGYEGVPTVEYPLWKLTLALLKKYRNKKTARTEPVLVNEDGGSLKTEKITPDGKYTKTDNIAVSYYRLCKRTGLDHKPLKLIRKTSATLLHNSTRFSQFAPLFLGHSPRGTAARFYYGKAGETFADAMRWLGQQYGQ
jgi:integrase